MVWKYFSFQTVMEYQGVENAVAKYIKTNNQYIHNGPMVKVVSAAPRTKEKSFQELIKAMNQAFYVPFDTLCKPHLCYSILFS